jgi:hypothetical protein
MEQESALVTPVEHRWRPAEGRFVFNPLSVEAMMKSWLWKLCLAAVFVWFMAFGGTAAAVAADDNPAGPGDRLQQLERRVNELAERQEQMMRRLSAQPEQSGRPGSRWAMPQERPGPVAPPELDGGRRPMPGVAMPPPAMAKRHDGLCGLIVLMLLAGIICNILLAVWIFTDIRKRGEGSGIFIALALVAGIPTAIIYALVRIGDRKDPAKDSRP